MGHRSRGTLACLLMATLSSSATAAELEGPALARKAEEILAANCYRCHGKDGANEGGFNHVLDRQRLVQRGKLVPGDAGKSKIYRRIISEDNPMPPEGESPRPSKDDISILKHWIDAGAPDFQTPAATHTLLTLDDIPRLIQADLEKAGERDRRFLRYFTIAHLHNAGLSEDELQSYRHGLSKLVNSLSWGSRIVVPMAIDPDKLILRIDLRDYQWTEKIWDTVAAADPYGVVPITEPAKFCSAATCCRLPFVRADWFVAVASKPPLYNEILQLPQTGRELEKMLRVDTAEDIRQERVVRAGFNSSGVSRNNRLIERHESGYFVYWRSYDFGGNIGRQNLFAHPIGPGEDDGAFQHDGGEIIFNLPNGLQGYLLTNGKGQRIDKGPTNIVSDPRRPDRAVENGISCMSCHARGLIDKADQVRDHVLKNRQAFAPEEVDTVLALYPPREKFLALLQADSQRFQEAVARTGAPLTATEPVAALALRFEAEIDLNMAAAEAGVTPAELQRALDQSTPLAQQIGSLKVKGGTVQRQVFVAAFPELVRELRLGEFPQSENRAAARHILEGDDLLKVNDLAGALAAYTEAVRLDPESPLARNNRGLVHAKRGELDEAIADYTEALRLDPKLAAAHHNRAAAYHKKGDYDQAIADYGEALRLEPQSAPVYNNRGFARFEQENFDQAISDFTEALRLDPRLVAAWNNRGLAHSRKNDLDRAIVDFTEALRLDPNFAKAYFNRGIAYEKKGDTTRASADREKALRLDPDLDKD